MCGQITRYQAADCSNYYPDADCPGCDVPQQEVRVVPARRVQAGPQSGHHGAQPPPANRGGQSNAINICYADCVGSVSKYTGCCCPELISTFSSLFTQGSGPRPAPGLTPARLNLNLVNNGENILSDAAFVSHELIITYKSCFLLHIMQN